MRLDSATSMANVDNQLLARVLGRSTSLFAPAVEALQAELRATIRGRRLLIIGAAGSIGAAFVRQVCAYGPTILHLLDLNENGLVEVVRELRSAELDLPADFQTYSIGLGSPELPAFIAGGFPYDTVINFAALKHVRAERDPCTMMRMLNTNVVYLDDLLARVAMRPGVERIFSVSSDKSVNPASAMGASKALMEEVLWLHAGHTAASSARFANVAFSAGSLLESFLLRLEKGQPLAAPVDVRRFFISHEEAGQLCLLGCFLAGNREIVFPDLDAEQDMQTFAEIAVNVLGHFGHTARECASEQEAKALAAALPATGAREWPVLFAESNTSGEKMYEEFYSTDETVLPEQWPNVGVVRHAAQPEATAARLRSGLAELRQLAAGIDYSKEALLSVLAKLKPGLQHVETGMNLDAKM